MSSPQITRILGLSIGVLARSADFGSPRLAVFTTAGLFVFAIAGFSSLFSKPRLCAKWDPSGRGMSRVGRHTSRVLAGNDAPATQPLRLPHVSCPGVLPDDQFFRVDMCALCAFRLAPILLREYASRSGSDGPMKS